MKVQWKKSIFDMKKEENVMNDTCSCPFADMKISDLEGLEKDNLVTQCIEWINALSKNISNETLIIEIANHLPAFEECAEIIGLENEIVKTKEGFKKAFLSIRFVIDHIINNGLYYESEETIKVMSIAISRHTQDEDYWKKKLLNNLEADRDLKFPETWLNNQEKINLVIETFNFPREGFDTLLGEALNNGFLDDLSNWTSNKNKIISLIQLFNLPRETMFKHLEDIIQERFSLFSEIDKMSDDEIIEKTEGIGREFLSACLNAETMFEILAQEGLHKKLVDQLMIKANESHNKKVRARLTNIAAYAYSYMNDRKKIWSFRDPDDINKTIRLASKIIGYSYKNQGIKDTWPLRYFY